MTKRIVWQKFARPVEVDARCFTVAELDVFVTFDLHSLASLITPTMTNLIQLVSGISGPR